MIGLNSKINTYGVCFYYLREYLLWDKGRFTTGAYCALF